jgi:hypothetical protein
LSQNRNKGSGLLSDDAFQGSTKVTELLDQSSDYKLLSTPWSKFIQWLPLTLLATDLTSIRRESTDLSGSGWKLVGGTCESCDEFLVNTKGKMFD